MARKLYLCVRPGEPDSLARRVQAAIIKSFGAEAVVGADRPAPDALHSAELVVLLIDTEWARALANEATSLTQTILITATVEDKTILPLLLGEATMPAAEDLPERLRFLHYRNALTIHDGAAFEQDMASAREQIETTLRGRHLGVQAGALALLAGGWFSLLLALSMVYLAIVAARPTAFTAPSGALGWFRGLLTDAPLATRIALTPLTLVSFYLALRLALWRRWGRASLLLLCALVMTVELARHATVAGLVAPWSRVAWLVALASMTYPAVFAALGALLALATLAARPSRLTYRQRSLMAAQRETQESALREGGTAPGVYISCRADDMSATYQALYDSLERNFKQFLLRFVGPYALWSAYRAPDAPHLPDWERRLEQSTTVIVVMGPHWQAGLASPDDPTRREVALALRLGKVIVPVLLDGAKLATPAELPAELAPLCFMQAIHITQRHGQRSGFNAVFARALDEPTTYSGMLADIVDRLLNYEPEVFISYRRADSAAMCDRIYQTLSRHTQIGRGVFRDTNAISAGVDFFAVLMNAIQSSRVVIALIGPKWLTFTDAAGARRLDNPEDMVRKELATALAQEKIIIPVLLNGARMPTAAELPDELAPLATLAPMQVSDGQRFAKDVAWLGTVAQRSLGVERHPRLMWLSVGALALWCAADLGSIVYADALTTYLLRLAPQWCFYQVQYQSQFVALCAQAPDMTVARILVALAGVALGATVIVTAAALARMIATGKLLSLALVVFALGWIATLGAGILAVAHGLAPAWLTVASQGAVSSLVLLPLALARALALTAIVLTLGFALYFRTARVSPPAHGAAPAP